MSELLIISIVVFGFAMVSGRLSLSPVTAPMVFTAVGLLLGALGGQWFHLDLESEAVSVLVTATLVLVLFTDAVRIDLSALRNQIMLPARLLGIGLPLTIVLGTLAAATLFTGLTIIEAALIAAVLARTDAALGQAVVSDKRLPVRIRQSLNVESGLNDGIMVPVVTVLLAIAATETGSASGNWGLFAAQQVGFGILAGVLVGSLGGWLLDRFARAGYVDRVYRLAGHHCRCRVHQRGGSRGEWFRCRVRCGTRIRSCRRRSARERAGIHQGRGELLESTTFLVFGAVLAVPVLGSLTW